jgi:hypothetical protein
MSDNKGGKLRIVMRLIKSLCILTACIGCLSAATVKSASPAHADSDQVATGSTVTIFLTGNVLGELKPCGCASGQLGGFERRPAILEKAPDDKKLVIDTGNFIDDETEQDIIKFGVIIQVLDMLGYDIVNLTDNDIRIAKELGLLESISFDVISYASDAELPIPASRTRELQIGDKCLLVAVASAKAESRQIESVQELFPTKHNGHDGPILNILITDSCQEPLIEHISDTAVVDVLICPASADEPAILDEKTKKPLLISVGQSGKYFGKLTVELAANQKLNLDYTKVPIGEELPADEGLVQLYKDYQIMVKEENLLEKVIKVPLPNDLEYLGSSSCGFGGSCHQYEYEKWSTKGHAKAYQTLVDVGSQYDPECIRCHVVGLEYETGFVSEKSPKDLRNVGCEACHGPGSKHMMAILTAEEDTETSEPKSACIDCHTPEHSNYEGREDEYLQKIVHWEEPKQNTNVKNQGHP